MKKKGIMDANANFWQFNLKIPYSKGKRRTLLREAEECTGYCRVINGRIECGEYPIEGENHSTTDLSPLVDAV